MVLLVTRLVLSVLTKDQNVMLLNAATCDAR